MTDVPRCSTTGKLRYGSAAHARRCTLHMSARTHAYRCEHCGSYHIASSEKR